MMVAPDKAAEAAVRGKHPTISFFFLRFGATEARQTGRKKGKRFGPRHPGLRYACPGLQLYRRSATLAELAAPS
jgi:hypothetical protein